MSRYPYGFIGSFSDPQAEHLPYREDCKFCGAECVDGEPCGLCEPEEEER